MARVPVGVDCPARASRRHDRMIKTSTGKPKTGGDVVEFEIRQFVDGLFRGQAGSEQIQHVRYADAEPAYAGAPSALVWVHGNPVGKCSHGRLLGHRIHRTVPRCTAPRSSASSGAPTRRPSPGASRRTSTRPTSSRSTSSPGRTSYGCRLRRTCRWRRSRQAGGTMRRRSWRCVGRFCSTDLSHCPALLISRTRKAGRQHTQRKTGRALLPGPSCSAREPAPQSGPSHYWTATTVPMPAAAESTLTTTSFTMVPVMLDPDFVTLFVTMTRM